MRTKLIITIVVSSTFAIENLLTRFPDYLDFDYSDPDYFDTDYLDEPGYYLDPQTDYLNNPPT